MLLKNGIYLRCLVPVAPDSSSYRVWFFLLPSPWNSRAVAPQPHENPNRQRPRHPNQRQTLPRRQTPRIRLHLRATTVKKSKIFCYLQSFPEKYSIIKVKSLPVDLFNFATFICKICCKNSRCHLLNALIILFFSLLPSVESRSRGIPTLSNMEFFCSSRFACSEPA